MGAGESAQDRLLQHALVSFQEEYKDLNDTWKLIDSKAQSSGTIAGIFLAAAFALARQLPVGFSLWQRYLLCVGIVLLIAAVCFALAGLQIRRISPPPIGQNLRQLVDDLLPNLSEAERDARMTAFTSDQMLLWQESNGTMREKASGKALWVSLSQYSLFAAIMVVTVVTLASVLN